MLAKEIYLLNKISRKFPLKIFYKKYCSAAIYEFKKYQRLKILSRQNRGQKHNSEHNLMYTESTAYSGHISVPPVHDVGAF